MAVTIQQLAENLVQSGLMSADEVSAFQEGLPPQNRPEGAQTLVLDGAAEEDPNVEYPDR